MGHFRKSFEIFHSGLIAERECSPFRCRGLKRDVRVGCRREGYCYVFRDVNTHVTQSPRILPALTGNVFHMTRFAAFLSWMSDSLSFWRLRFLCFPGTSRPQKLLTSVPRGVRRPLLEFFLTLQLFYGRCAKKRVLLPNSFTSCAPKRGYYSQFLRE